MLLSLIALTAMAGGVAWLVSNRAAPVVVEPAPARAAHLSIVVLPFANLSGDASQDYFVDGVTENLTTELSRIRNSFVIARNTAFTYRDKSIDARQIGRELGVRYVLEGSVQRDQNRVRVNAQLIDAETGAHLWADRFEEEVADLFNLQDQVVARLSNSLGIEMVRAEAAKGARVRNPDVIDLTMRGWAMLNIQPPKKDENAEARSLFEQALKNDPADADALAGSATTFLHEYSFWRNPETDYNTELLGQADRAIALAADVFPAYYAKSIYLFYLRRPKEALATAEAGIAVNPNNAGLYGARALADNALLRFESAQSDLQVAFRLSPRDPQTGFWYFQSCVSQIGSGHFAIASDECQKAIESGYRTQYSWAAQASAYALDGNREEAKSAVAEALRLNPKLTVKWLIANIWDYPAYIDGLRAAGMPEE